MAKVGAPLGNKNAVGSRPWTEALNRAIAQDDGKRLRQGAEALLDKIAEGDTAAMALLGDRIEGKAAQSVTLANDVDHPLIQHLDTSRLSVEQLATIAAIKISKE